VTYRWSLTLVDDTTQESSASDDFNIYAADHASVFTGPYQIPVIGQPHTFYWSPSTAPTVSILLVKSVPLSTVNITLADHVKNDGSFTWAVPSSDDLVAPGVWNFDLIEDSTGAIDSSAELTIDAGTPSLCP